METATAKRLLRRRAHRLRNGLSPDARTQAEPAILAHLLALPELSVPRRILAYASIRSEVATAPIIEALVHAGHEVALPRVEEDATLTARPLGPLQPGFHGIPEPDTAAIPWASIEIALVPGLAFDAHGHRLGYGGGFFDRALMAFKGTIVGIAFAVQLVDEVPSGPVDVDVDLIVTEDGPIRVAAAR